MHFFRHWKMNDFLFFFAVDVDVLIFLADQGVRLGDTKRTDGNALWTETGCGKHEVVCVLVI